MVYFIDGVVQTFILSDLTLAGSVIDGVNSFHWHALGIIDAQRKAFHRVHSFSQPPI